MLSKMVDEWDKYAAILETEEKAFRRVMEEEVSNLLSSKFSSKHRILAGVDIITQREIDLLIFKQCLALLSGLL